MASIEHFTGKLFFIEFQYVLYVAVSIYKQFLDGMKLLPYCRIYRHRQI